MVAVSVVIVGFSDSFTTSHRLFVYGFFLLLIVSFSSLCFHTHYQLKSNMRSFIVPIVSLKLL